MPKKIIKEGKRILQAWKESNATTFGASVAYTVFSIAPLLVIAISIASIFLSSDVAAAGIINEFRSTFGENGAELVETLIKSKASTETSIILSIVGFVVLLLGAAGIFSQLQKALDTIFESLNEKKKSGIWTTIRQKLLSFGMVLSVGFLLLVSLALSAFLNYFFEFFGNTGEGTSILIKAFEFIISLALISFFLSLTYKILPSKKLKWKQALIGGGIAGVLFTLSKYFLGLYLSSSSAFTSYGAASSLVLLIIWTYYMSQVFFLGAILTKLYVRK